MIQINGELSGEIINVGENYRVHSALIKSIHYTNAEVVTVTYLDNTVLLCYFKNYGEAKEAYEEAYDQWSSAI